VLGIKSLTSTSMFAIRTVVRSPNDPEPAPPRLSRAATHPSDHVQSLERGLAVLCAFSREHPALTLSEVARDTGLPRATARRLLHTLQTLGYINADRRSFQLTPKVLDIGYAYVSSLALSDLALPTMEALSEQVHESCSAAVLDDTEIVYVARVPTKRIMTIALALGSRLPAATTSMGRVLLADLPQAERDEVLARTELVAHTDHTVTDVRQLNKIIDEAGAQGWCLVDQELEMGLRSIAAPLRDAGGRAVAAMNISTHAARVTVKQMREEFVPRLLAATQEIDERLAKR
jgi:IclR family pca regulon transcriptional regulator